MLRQGTKNLKSVLNRVAKSEIFALNGVRVKTPGPHLPTRESAECPPRGNHEIGPGHRLPR